MKKFVVAGLLATCLLAVPTVASAANTIQAADAGPPRHRGGPASGSAAIVAACLSAPSTPRR